jgi:hypothetical protein
MNVADEIIGDIQQHTAGLIYLGNDIAGRKFEEIRVMVVGDSSEVSFDLPFSFLSLLLEMLAKHVL